MKELLKEIEGLQKGTLMAHADGSVTQIHKPRKIQVMWNRIKLRKEINDRKNREDI
jgi:hypothetical protein